MLRWRYTFFFFGFRRLLKLRELYTTPTPKFVFEKKNEKCKITTTTKRNTMNDPVTLGMHFFFFFTFRKSRMDKIPMIFWGF